MARRNNKMVMNDFYCMNCGKKNMTLPRRDSHQHGRFHRKRLYCFYCKEEVNHIECKTYEDVMEFRENFENGVYEDEAKDSISYVRSRGIGEEHIRQGANGSNNLSLCACVKR